ncbi:hypothetical protein EV363DRAFT_1169057 [Boletus edulis]|uniref:Uncharacterized protein n=1 Tax=Boletus edulis BED1 TaxID=1328754 RepID=A0AAD4BQR3_BOLED|nr:hypothetical protein EV363DRAFT_1174040 [Boletus edulis]KAF8129161.1 hypothetical protein EV363DRAFT_1169057 [Boletus edulis]KAF8437485.1 hypothetical protein L210DRAFT_504451 [Boletus edulis BED1]
MLSLSTPSVCVACSVASWHSSSFFAHLLYLFLHHCFLLLLHHHHQHQQIFLPFFSNRLCPLLSSISRKEKKKHAEWKYTKRRMHRLFLLSFCVYNGPCETKGSAILSMSPCSPFVWRVRCRQYSRGPGCVWRCST